MDEATKTTEVPLEESSAAPSTGVPADLGDPVVPEGPPTESLPDPWKKVRKLAQRQLDRFISLEPKVLRGDDPDAIHDLRVASRRMQQVLDLLYPAPHDGEIRKLRRRIRRSRRALGEVRNCDVQLARVTRILASKRAARRETWEAVRHYLLRRRSKCFEKSARHISKLNLAVFYVRLREVLSPNGHFPAAHHRGEVASPGPEQFHERVNASLESVWQAFEAQVTESHRDPKVGVIHGVRIAAKRLRYLIEVVREFDVPGSKAALAWLRDLQTHLGNWHDLEVLEQIMIELVARPEFLRDHLEIAMGVERLIAKNRKGKGTFRQKYFEMTLHAARYEHVKAWVAGLLAEPRGIV